MLPLFGEQHRRVIQELFAQQAVDACSAVHRRSFVDGENSACIINFKNFLGRHLAEKPIDDLLVHFAIAKKPRRHKGSDTAYVSNLELGVELTFIDCESLDDASGYPDGALVLANIRFYGIPNHEFSKYAGDLPEGIQFGETKDEILRRLGEPNWTGMDGAKFRWNQEATRLLVSFDDEDRVDIVSLDLPS